MVAVVGIAGHAQAAKVPSAPDKPPTALPSLLAGKWAKPRHLRLDAVLNSVVETFERNVGAAPEAADPMAQAQTRNAAAHAAAARAPISDGASVAVTLRIADAAQVETIAQFLRDNGGDPRNLGTDYIEAYVPVALLVKASEQPGVTQVRAIIPPQPKRGPIVSEGVRAHGADSWHKAGLTGKGVKVGVIDTGFAGLQRLRGSELPRNVVARCYRDDVGRYSANLADCVNERDPQDGHGTAVAEALMDVAPDASLYIADPMSNGDLRGAVDWMASRGVRVINHSVGHPWDGPGDGTSPYSESPLNTVDAAVAQGIVWVNAAGNEGRSAWFGPWIDADGDGFHEFSRSRDCNRVSAGEGRLQIQLRWQGSWGLPSRMADLNLYLVDEGRGELAAWSEDQNPVSIASWGTGMPSESIDIDDVVDAGEGPHCVGVRWATEGYSYPVAPPRWIQLIVHTPQSLEISTDRSIGNPAESANLGLLAVGAAAHGNLSIQYYSSHGPTPDGRIKPDIVGVDGARSSSVGEWMGTSQASPHVAGLAALVRGIVPHYSPPQLVQYLLTNASDRGARGPDYAWGWGLARLPSLPVVDEPVALNLTALFQTADSATRYSATSSDPSALTAVVQGSQLILTPVEGTDGGAIVAVTARFRNGTTLTVRIVVTAEATSAQRPFMSGWRLILQD